MNKTNSAPLWSALTSYLIGLLWVCCFMAGFGSMDAKLEQLYPLLFALVFFVWAGAALRAKPAHREHFFWLACSLLIALAIAMGRTRAVDAWACIALHGFAAYWVLCRSGLLTDRQTGSFLPLDLLYAGIVFPLGGFFLRIRTIAGRAWGFLSRRRNSNPGSRKNALMTALVILAALPVLFLAAELLGQADESFRALLDALGSFLTFTWKAPDWLLELRIRFLFGLPVGAYLFGLVGGCFLREAPGTDAGAVRRGLPKLRIAPAAALTAVFCGFCALYLLFFIVQAGHLLGAFFGNVPGTLTAAQYARSGFFQLCVVMAINFGLLAAAMLVSQASVREHRVLRICADVLMVQSIFLAVTAASKLLLYIHRFGFTPLRLLSMWGILILTAGAVQALRSLAGKSGTFKQWVFFSAATFTALCFY